MTDGNPRSESKSFSRWQDVNPIDRPGPAEKRTFLLIRLYLDRHGWGSSYNTEGIEAAIKAVAAMTDEEAQALLVMHLLDRTVNK